MVIRKSICDICGNTESQGWMHQGGYQTCSKCSHDITLFETQPFKDHNLKILLEVFCKRGKGENITFKEIHKEKSNYKLITFENIFVKSEIKSITSWLVGYVSMMEGHELLKTNIKRLENILGLDSEFLIEDANCTLNESETKNGQ